MKRNHVLMSSGVAALVLFAAGPATTWAARQPVYHPEPIQIPCALGAEKIRATVRNSVLSRGWVPSDKGAGVVEARIDKKNLVAIVTIAFDAKNVRIRYKSSEGFSYEGEGAGATIHSRYNSWIKNMEKDITLNLSRACG
jgi:hypothetical protein